MSDVSSLREIRPADFHRRPSRYSDLDPIAAELQMIRARRAPWHEGVEDAGPCQSSTEDTEDHVHEWQWTKLGRPAPA